jgi:DNA-binding beta-propeller fold protein YncE
MVSTVVGPIHLGDGSFEEAFLINPRAMTPLESESTFLVADGLHGQIRLVDLAARTVSSVAGYPGGALDSGGEDPAGATHLFDGASGIVVDEVEVPAVAYVAERSGQVIRRIRMVSRADPSTWTVSVLAGQYQSAGHADGALSASLLSGPSGLALDVAGRRLYVADSDNHVIRVIDLDAGEITTIAGTPGFADYIGENLPADESLFNEPVALLLGPGGILYVAEAGNHRVRSIDSDGTVRTVLGNGLASSAGDGAPADAFGVHSPQGLALDDHGNLFVSATDAVRLVTAGTDGVATGDDAVITIYGELPKVTFPETATRCLSDLRLVGTGDQLYLLDSCQGYLLRLDRSVGG